MAPQNSTLIHEHIESTSELSRYSPILPIKENDKANIDHNHKSICNNTVYDIEQVFYKLGIFKMKKFDI